MKRDRQSVEDRHTRMLSLLRERRTLRVEELSELFHVSLMTVRRDLQILEDAGLIERFYGGATANPESEEDGISHSDACRLISRCAASLVEDGDHLFINGSGTALDLLNYVGSKTVTVFTNNGAAIGRSFPLGVEVTISGGVLRGQLSILTGDCAIRNLLMVQAEKAFLGCVGISPDGEILCGIPTELSVNETMLSHAREYYILADHTKIGKAGTYASFSLEKPGTVVTDYLAPEETVERLRLLGMRVIQVQKNGEYT